ncbi:15668_t:CDS:2, partial [Funneliformis geosporum]
MAPSNNQLLLELLQEKLFNKFPPTIKNQTFFYAGQLKVADLSEIFQVPLGQVIKFFWNQGIAVNQNQNLSAELINSYCQSHGIKSIQPKEPISFNALIEEYLRQIDQKENLVPRPPIVSVMGHIDHGKTTLLDTIRGSQVQKEEKGGITQKISIYPIIFSGQKIIFCDTPGHSDFIKMRQRGVSLTDLVILVIDARDGIMPQTKEIINYLHQYQLPVIVFFNHKKPAKTNNEANLAKLRSQLQEQDLTPANPQLPAYGLIIDSKISSQLGKVTTLLVQGGTLREKDLLFTKGKLGKIKRMLDFQGKGINQALPSDLAQVIGLDFLAQAGEKFLTVREDKWSKKINELLADYQKERDPIGSGSSAPPSTLLDSETEKQKPLNLIVAADTQAALEVLVDLVTKTKNTDGSALPIIAHSVGNLHDQLLNLAKITRSYLLIYNLKLNQTIRQKLKENQLKWFQSEIIYEIEEKLTELIQQTRETNQVEKVLGTAEVKQVFYFSKLGNIAGCQVINGTIERNNLIHVLRQGRKIFSGKIKSLESEKFKVNEVRKGQECGIVAANFDDFQVKDQIISYRWEEEDQEELPFFSVSYCVLSTKAENLKVYLVFAHAEDQNLLEVINQIIKEKKLSPYREQDLIRLMSNLEAENILEPQEVRLLRAAFNFDEETIEKYFKPRKKVIFLSTEMSFPEIQQ